MTIEFTRPRRHSGERVHHARAAAGNAAVADEAVGVLRDALSGTAEFDRILLKVAAGAGKSYVLARLVVDAVEHSRCVRVSIVAFTNKQIHPLAKSIGSRLGKDRVCLFVARDKLADVPPDAAAHATVATSTAGIPAECAVVISTSHKLGALGEAKRQREHLGPARQEDFVFDVLFVD